MKKLLMSRDFWETVVIILIAVVLFVVLRISIQTYIVYGPSMEPHYWEDEWIIVDKLAYKFSAPQRGDIIVFQPPISSTKPFIKRIVGLPGESVEIENGIVYVRKTDGSVTILQEPYLKEAFSANYNSGIIPANEYFVMGDNRNNSSDSRGGWFASRDKVIGRAWISIWPPRLWGLAPTYRQPATVPSTAGN